MTQNWDSIYRRHGSWLVLPHEDMPKVAESFKARGVKCVLDLGCGEGRHVIYLAQQGFDIYGLDSSAEAIKKAEELLAENELHAELTVASMFEKLPYPDSFFDAIVCTKALNHGTIESIRRAIREIERILKVGGTLFLVVTKSRKILESEKQKREAEILAERTLIPKTGREIGIIHYQFTKEILLGEFQQFKVISFRVDSMRNYCLLGELKPEK